MMYYFVAIYFVLASANCCLAAPSQQNLDDGQLLHQDGGFDLSKAPPMNTNIALVTSGDLKDKLDIGQNVLLDPAELVRQATPVESSAVNDIEEDPKDRFITTRSGKRRPELMDSSEASEWTDDMPSAKVPRILSRVKRCGGGDDDGANRARRARRRRANRARRARRAQRRAAKRRESSSTTTVTRKVIQNGQVVSQTTETAGAPQVVHSVASAAPVVVHQQQPAVVHQSTVPVVAAPQQVVQQPAVAAPVAAAVPSVAVQGSVKIN